MFVSTLHVPGWWWYLGRSPGGPGTEASCASLLQTPEEIFQHLQSIVDFGKNVMKEFLGENYVHCGVSDFCSCGLSSWAPSVSVTPLLNAAGASVLSGALCPSQTPGTFIACGTVRGGAAVLSLFSS